MNTLAIGAALLPMIALVSPTIAEEPRTIFSQYVGAITSDPEKDSFGYLSADLSLKAQNTILLTEEARHVGLRTGDEEKDTFARIEVRREWTAGIDE